MPPENRSGEDVAAASGDVQALIELLFFAYRDFTSDPDDLLKKDGFGRAHHRVVHFVDRNPGMRVADLLDILRITKQSLGRVLRQLVDRGYIEQREGPNDRRERRLYVTEQGARLAETLARPQRQRIAQALSALPEGGDAIARAFLLELVNPSERDKVEAIVTDEKTAP